jgi:hypothetical protein
MLTDPAIQQLIHLIKRVRDSNSNVLNYNSKHEQKFIKGVILKIKSYDPDIKIPTSMTKWFNEKAIEIVNKRKGNKKYDAVIAGDYLESICEFFQRFEQIYNSCKQNGFIVIDLPFSVNSGWFSYQPNLFKQIASQNNCNFSYFKIMDHAGQFPISIDSTKRLSDTVLREMLYKYRNTVNMRINVTLQKTTSEPFSFKDPT